MAEEGDGDGPPSWRSALNKAKRNKNKAKASRPLLFKTVPETEDAATSLDWPRLGSFAANEADAEIADVGVADAETRHAAAKRAASCRATAWWCSWAPKSRRRGAAAPTALPASVSDRAEAGGSASASA